MCSKDGSPLCLGGELCWSLQLQVFSSFLGKFMFFDSQDCYVSPKVVNMP